MYEQVLTPNPNIPCKPGWCLEYVQNAFGTGHGDPDAITQWKHTKQHADRNFPKLWIPIFFTMKNVPEGHVAILAPDGSVWSSSHPTATTPVHHSSISALESYYGGRLGFLGWGETLNNKPVIKGESMASFEMLQQLSQAVLGRKEPVTRAWYDSNPAERSMTTEQVLDSWIPSQEAKDFRFKAWDYDKVVANQPNLTILKPGKYEVK